MKLVLGGADGLGLTGLRNLVTGSWSGPRTAPRGTTPGSGNPAR